MGDTLATCRLSLKALLFFLLLVSAAFAATDIGACPYTVSSSGEYTLSSDLTASGTSCITIDTNDVLIDGGGHSIIGTNTSGTYGVYANSVSNISVVNLNVSNFTTAIYYLSVTTGRIENNTAVTSFNQSGGNTCKNCAIYMLSSSFVNITRNNATSLVCGDGTYQDSGIFLWHSSNNIVSFNNATGCMRGLTLSASQYNNVLNNTARSQLYGALSIFHSSLYSNISGNNVSSILGNAIDSWDSASSTYRDNTAYTGGANSGLYFGQGSYNTVIGGRYTGGLYGILVEGGSLGIRIENATFAGPRALLFWDSDNATVINSVMNCTSGGMGVGLWYDSKYHYFANNRIYTSDASPAVSLVGYSASSYALGNVFYNNTFVTSSGDLVSANAFSPNNTFYMNNFTNTTGYYVNDAGNTTILTYNRKGNLYANVANGSVNISGVTAASEYPGFWYGNQGSAYPYNSSNSFGKISAGLTDTRPITSIHCTSNCLDEITLLLNGSYSNFSYAYNPAATLTVSASSGSGNELLYRNGTQVAKPYSAVLSAGYYNFTANSSGGSYLPASDSLFVNVTKAGAAITLNATTWLVGPGNQTNVTCSVNNSQTPIFLYRNDVLVNSSIGSQISDMEILPNETYSYACNSTESQNYTAAVQAQRNLVVGESLQCGDPLASPGTYSLALDITGSGTCLSVGAENVTIDCKGHSITFAGAGCSTFGIYSNRTGTRITNCSISGFDAEVYFRGVTYGEIKNSTLATGTLCNIYGYGAVIESGSYSNFTNITATTSSNAAFYMTGSSWNNLTNVNGTTHGDSFNGGGLRLEGSNYNTLLRCNGSAVSSSGTFGTAIVGSHYNTVINSTAYSDSYAAFWVRDSNYNTLTGVSAYSPADKALLIEESNYNNVSGSYGNGGTWGIGIAGGTQNSIANSTGFSGTGAGLAIAYTNANNVSNSQFSSSSGYGVNFDTSPTNTYLFNNTITSLASTGIFVTGTGHTFLRNNITASIWVNGIDSGNSYNNSTAGNIYYFANGTPSWDIYPVYDINGDSWGDIGNAVPFGTATVSEWSGSGADYHPYSNLTIDFALNSVSISPAIAPPSGQFSCFVNAYSAVGQMNVRYEWYQNGVNKTILAGVFSNLPNNTAVEVSNVSAPYLVLNDTWYCRASIQWNATNSSGWRQSSNATVSFCQNVTETGATITINENATSAGTCISILAENVTIDCKGHFITGNNTAGTYGIESSMDGTIVKDCAISGFETAIYFQGNAGSIQNTSASTTVASGYGAYLYTSDYNSISNSSFNSNNIGLSMQFSSYNNISRSTAMSTGSDGIYMDTSASNRITDTTVTSSAGIGISILFSGSNVLANVTATSDGDSLYMWGSASNAISNSTFTSANGYGIDLSGSASNSFINVSNNRNYTDPNQKFYSDAAQDVTSSYLNTGYWPLLNSRGADATDISKTAYYNGTAGGKSWNAGLSDWVSAPNNRYWYNNQTNYTFGCGAILESGSTYQLDRNLTEASSSNCFDLNSLTNVTFDCNGHKITGPTGSGTAAFSLLLTNYATIKNCVIDGFDTGIDARGQAPGFICHHFCEWQDGIYYNGHNFTNNTISAGNAGVYQSYINSSSISDSRISSASNVAVDLESVAYSTITNSNIASANGVGIFIVGNGIDTGANTISNSNVTSVNGHGIYLSASTYNTISNVNSTASGANANGIYIASSSSNTISNAYAYSQDRVGIWIDGSNYNSIDRSTGIGIGTDEHGIIILSVSSYNNITNSNGTATNGNGIWVDNGDRNQIINCIGTSTGGRGLMLSSASNNIIANSTGTSTSSYGAYLTASSINSIINSTIRSTNTNAFYITGGSDQNTFYWNSFVAPNGLYISDDSGGTNFFNTTIGGHAEGNIYPNISSSNFTGNVSSSYGASWWVGTAGNAYPYSITASGGKITSGVVDYGPLFYTFVPTPIPPPAPGTNNGGGEVYIPPAEQPATPAVEPQPSEQNVTPPAQPQLHTFESATKAIADAEAALNEAVKEGRDISQSVWALSAARDALAKGDYAEAERLAALAVSQIGEKGSSAPSGQIGEPGIPQIVEQNGLPLATIVIIGGAVALLGAGIFAYMTWGRKN